MRTLEFSIYIDRPPEDVFDFITNPDNDHLWQAGLISSEWITPEPAGLGSAKRATSRFMGREMEVEVEFVAWNRPNSYAFEAETGPISVAATTRFEAQDSGTLVTVAGQIEASGIVRLAEGYLIRRTEKQDLANFTALKRILEAG